MGSELWLYLFLFLVFGPGMFVSARPKTTKNLDDAISLNVPRKRNTLRIGNSRTAPCGGNVRGVIRQLSAVGDGIMVQWKAYDSDENLFCRIAISDGIDNDRNFLPLLPLDKSSDSNGLFPCGRENGAIESKIVSLPSDFSCEQCTLQLTWRNSKNIYYSCSDVSYPEGILYDPQITGNPDDLPLWMLYLLNILASVGTFAVLSHLYKMLEDDVSDLLSPYMTKEKEGKEDIMDKKEVETLGNMDDGIVEERGIRKKPRPKPLENLGLEEPKEEPSKAEELKQEPSTPTSAYDLSTLQQDSISGSLVSSPREGDLPSPSGTPQFTPEMEQNFMESIKKVVESKQAEEAKEFIKSKETGKVSWSKTHFIFALDCSGSMTGARWDSVMVGFSTCLHRIKRMKEVCVSAFTFDVKPNPFCRERSPHQAITNFSQIPFTGKGTDYKRALKYAIALMNKTRHPEFLTCIMFLSDGFGGYPTECVNELKTMRTKGKKILFYTIACDTEEETEMIKMANELQGEHYKVTDPEAAKLVFSAILNV